MARTTRLMLMVVTILLLLPAVSAHTQKEFTVILLDEGPVPSGVGEGVLFEGDYLFFRNHDSRDGARHRVLIDADGDGTFEGLDDINTGWMDTACETNETGHKLDEDCQAAALVHLSPETGLLPSNLTMLVQIEYDGVLAEHPFYANYAPDEHDLVTEPSDQPVPEEHRAAYFRSLIVLSLIGASFISLKLLRSTEDEE